MKGAITTWDFITNPKTIISQWGIIFYIYGIYFCMCRKNRDKTFLDYVMSR